MAKRAGAPTARLEWGRCTSLGSGSSLEVRCQPTPARRSPLPPPATAPPWVVVQTVAPQWLLLRTLRGLWALKSQVEIPPAAAGHRRGAESEMENVDGRSPLQALLRAPGAGFGLVAARWQPRGLWASAARSQPVWTDAKSAHWRPCTRLGGSSEQDDAARPAGRRDGHLLVGRRYAAGAAVVVAIDGAGEAGAGAALARGRRRLFAEPLAQAWTGAGPSGEPPNSQVLP